MALPKTVDRRAFEAYLSEVEAELGPLSDREVERALSFFTLDGDPKRYVFTRIANERSLAHDAREKAWNIWAPRIGTIFIIGLLIVTSISILASGWGGCG